MSGPVSRRLLFLSAVAFAALAGPARAQDSVATLLKRYEDEWAAADLTKDTVVVARMLANTYVSAGAGGAWRHSAGRSTTQATAPNASSPAARLQGAVCSA